jgi:hypothetical protein
MALSRESNKNNKGFVITRNERGASPPLAQRSFCLGRRQAVFDAELAGIKVLMAPLIKHMVIHSDSTSAIARAGHSRAGLGQRTARDIQKCVTVLARVSRSAQIAWFEGHFPPPPKKSCLDGAKNGLASCCADSFGSLEVRGLPQAHQSGSERMIAVGIAPRVDKE